MEHLLTQAAYDISIRSQVEETLSSILHDVETAYSLEQSLNNHNVLRDLQEKYAAIQLRYEEREAVWEMERREKERLGVALLEEIVKLSARGVREEKERRSLEMQLQRLMSDGKQSADLSAVTKNQESAAPPHVAKGINELSLEDPATDVGESAQLEETGPVPTSDDTTNDDAAVCQKEEPITEGSANKVTINLHELNESILMNMFSFMDPMDVMNFAQINKAMFTRIDTLFGMGSTAVSSDTNAGTATVPKEPQVSTASTTDTTNSRPPLPPGSVTSTTVAQSSASVASVNSQSSGTALKTSPKLFAMPSPTIPSIVGPSSGASWIPRFGSATDASSVALASQSTTTAPTHTRAPSTGSAGSAVPDTEIKLNAAMANSMASKLSPAELSVILRMREKLQKCEADAARSRQEKEDAVANLASVEAVKEFLVARVRDTEKTVQNQKEEMKEVQKKNLADQEVIIFLDERVKKLEGEVNDIKSQESIAKQEAADAVAKNEKKVRVLSDMLRFEREQMASNEREWKNTKKLLVKEVKSCRSHIVTLEAELDGLKRQNEQLKQGLRVTSPPNKGLKYR
ncbi:hypothetical protein ACHAWO_010140 [Cyclotella atomus]|uniref:Uncharacterized protein n=1 Tax=Cyclotella atomus TaxID=382360 RepID=A0ABD3Q5X7_9STRA